MRKLIIVFAVFISLQPIFSQTKYYTKQGKVSFYSNAEKEKIEAHNNRAISIFQKETEELEFSVLIKSFLFKKALMQEHFNENYMESEKFPKAKFKGYLEGIKSIDLTKDGEHLLPVKGKLTMHGVTNQIVTSMKVKVISGSISANSEFNVFVKDYNIKIPSIVGKKVAEEIKIKVIIEEYLKLDKK